MSELLSKANLSQRGEFEKRLDICNFATESLLGNILRREIRQEDTTFVATDLLHLKMQQAQCKAELFEMYQSLDNSPYKNYQNSRSVMAKYGTAVAYAMLGDFRQVSRGINKEAAQYFQKPTKTNFDIGMGTGLLIVQRGIWPVNTAYQLPQNAWENPKILEAYQKSDGRVNYSSYSRV